MASSRKAAEKRGGKPGRSVLSDETHDAIRAMLLDHTITPGQHINIDALARELDVSQTPVREALARLESDDLVVKQPLRGYAATELLTVAQVDDLFRFRSLIEPWAAAQAAKSITDVSARELVEELAHGKRAGSRGIDEAYAAMSEHDARFHTLIARLSGSEFIKDAFVRTHCHLHLFRLYQASRNEALNASDGDFVGTLFSLYYQPDSGFLAFHEHEEIANAILAGDAASAESRMKDHIENSRERFAPAVHLINQK